MVYFGAKLLGKINEEQKRMERIVRNYWLLISNYF
jgi:hypothetical protein